MKILRLRKCLILSSGGKPVQFKKLKKLEANFKDSENGLHNF